MKITCFINEAFWSEAAQFFLAEWDPTRRWTLIFDTSIHLCRLNSILNGWMVTETRLTKLDISLQARHVYQYLCNVTQERVTKPALCAFQYNGNLVGICFFNQVHHRCILFNAYLYFRYNVDFVWVEFTILSGKGELFLWSLLQKR